MASCEPYCSSIYSEDLRWRRMIWLCNDLGYTHTRSAESLKLTKIKHLQVRSSTRGNLYLTQNWPYNHGMSWFHLSSRDTALGRRLSVHS